METVRCPNCQSALERKGREGDLWGCVYNCKQQWRITFEAVDAALTSMFVNVAKEAITDLHHQERTPKVNDGVFPHECEEEGCPWIVPFDDEPKCFTHSPDSGSSVRGYSARAEATKKD